MLLIHPSIQVRSSLYLPSYWPSREKSSPDTSCLIFGHAPREFGQQTDSLPREYPWVGRDRMTAAPKPRRDMVWPRAILHPGAGTSMPSSWHDAALLTISLSETLASSWQTSYLIT